MRKIHAAMRSVNVQSAKSLGWFRTALAALFLLSPERAEALRMVHMPRALWVAPPGLEWFLRWVPISVLWVQVASWVYVTAAVCVVVGLFTRPALLALLASAFYVFAIRQLGGNVLHNMHLLWFLAILCVSDVGKAPDPRAAAISLFWIRSLLGIIYFFPGYWKLRASGLAWALSDNLANQMHAKWFEFGTVPILRLDAHEGVLHALGVGTLLFELGFIVLVHLGPRIRLLLLAGGLVFHWMIQWQLKIPFASLWVCYLALLGPSLSFDGLSLHASLRGGNRGMVFAIGAFLSAMAIKPGATGSMQSFPFACYPTFQWLQGKTLQDLTLSYVDGQGQHFVELRQGRSQQQWGEVWSVLGLTSPYSETRLKVYLARVVPAGLPRPLEVGIGHYHTAPERWRDPPISVQWLLRLE